MRVRAALAAGVAVLLLQGCASSPKADLNRALTDVTERANDRDAAGLRRAATALIALVNRQAGSDLKVDEADRIRADAQRVLADADLLDAPPPAAVPLPSRSSARPTPSSTPTASRTPSASPTPTPAPTAPPAPTPAPSTSAPTKPPSPTPTRTRATPTPSEPVGGKGKGKGDGNGGGDG